jgi:hypothetical protein
MTPRPQRCPPSCQDRAWLVIGACATALLAGISPWPASAQGAAAAASPQTPAPPPDSKGFQTTQPKTTPGQSLVPPPGRSPSGVIIPPQSIDRGITRPTPPARAFPTPVIRTPVAPQKPPA